MKKTTFFFIALTLSISAIAQPIINMADVTPNIGEQFTTHTTTYTSPGASGAGVTWNFASLTASNNYSYSYSNPSGTPFSSNFSGATTCIITSGTSYSYQKASSTELNDMGWASSTSGYFCNYSNPKLLMSFPFNYNATVNDTYYGAYTAGASQIVNQGTIQYKYDGYGTLILPTGTINNVVRFKVTDAASNSSTTSGSTFTYTQTQTTYMWLKPGEHCPVLYFSETVTVTNGNSTTSNYAYYHTPNAIGIDENSNANNNFKLYPIPASEKITLLIEDNTANSYEIVDITGKIIVENKNIFNEKTISVNVESLADGIYFLKIKDNAGQIIEVKKFQKN